METSHLFLFLDELGGSKALMGLSLTVTCAAEIPMLFFSGWVIRRVGVIGVLYFVLATYFVRLMYYSMLSNAWAVLPIETLHGITFGCGFSAGTMRAAELSPPGLVSTTQGLFNAAFFGLGSGIGVLGGGIIYQHFGAVVLFRSVACVMGGGLILFAWSERYSHMHGAGYETVSMERDEHEKMTCLSPPDIHAYVGRGEEGQVVELVSRERNTQMATDLETR